MAACVKLRGLPWTTDEQEIIQFFHSIPVGKESITFLYNHEGRPSGEAFVWMHEDHVNQALKNNKEMLGHRYVEVFASNNEEYETQMARSGVKGQVDSAGNPAQGQMATDCVLRIRGCPFTVTKDDMVQHFAQFGVDREGVFLGLTTSGPRTGDPSGEAYIKFPSAELAQQALDTMQHSRMDTRYLELFASTEHSIHALGEVGGIAGYVGSGRPPVQRNGHNVTDLNPQVNRPGSAWIRLRGLPFSATQWDVVQFMAPATVVNEDDVTIKYGSDGRPSGEAFIQLDNEEAVEYAVKTLHRKNMGSRFIEAFQSSYEETKAVRHNQGGGGKGGKGWGDDSWGGGGKGGKGKGGKGKGGKGGGWEPYSKGGSWGDSGWGGGKGDDWGNSYGPSKGGKGKGGGGKSKGKGKW